MILTIYRQGSVIILKAFEHFDRASKVMCKEFAHSVHDAFRDAARNFPLSSTNKSRPVNMNEKTESGILIQEEINNVLEKIYKAYLKE